MADTLESCVCGQCFDCPDGYHSSDELPCSCAADCVLGGYCSNCDASLADGEGQDGYCGNCADRLACEEHGDTECEECRRCRECNRPIGTDPDGLVCDNCQ